METGDDGRARAKPVTGIARGGEEAAAAVAEQQAHRGAAEDQIGVAIPVDVGEGREGLGLQAAAGAGVVLEAHDVGVDVTLARAGEDEDRWPVAVADDERDVGEAVAVVVARKRRAVCRERRQQSRAWYGE